MCIFSVPLRPNDFSHCSHLCFLSPLWMSRCEFKWHFLLNDLLHCWQLFFFSAPWVSLWFLRLLAFANVFSHKSQNISCSIFQPFRLRWWHRLKTWCDSQSSNAHTYFVAFPFTFTFTKFFLHISTICDWKIWCAKVAMHWNLFVWFVFSFTFLQCSIYKPT